jgi:siroheme synthase
VASAFLVVSGHDEQAFASAIGQLQPNGVTVVVLMGLGRSAAIACELIDRGWSRGTPAAIIVNASRPQQQVWRGTLDGLALDQAEIEGDGAGTLVIGDVVAVGLQSADRSPEGSRCEVAEGSRQVAEMRSARL